MIIKDAQFVTSAVNLQQTPETNLPEIVLVGRSNVGKSSFINKMLNRKNLARTSSTPGKTRTINFYLINQAFYFVDLPGYGYAQISQAEKEKWGKMIEEYLQKRTQIKVVLQLIDARHEPSKNDLEMYEWLKFNSLPFIIIATKIDKLSNNQLAKQTKILRESLKLKNAVNFIPFSAETGAGVKETWDLLLPIINI